LKGKPLLDMCTEGSLGTGWMHQRCCTKGHRQRSIEYVPKAHLFERTPFAGEG